MPTDPGVFANPIETFVIPVAGNSAFKETIALRLPLSNWSVYASSIRANDLKKAKSLDFTIGYEPSSPSTRLEEIEIEGVKVYRVVGTDQKTAANEIPDEKTLTSKVLMMEIPLK